LSVQFALAAKPAGVRVLPLEGFAPLEVARSGAAPPRR